MFRAGNRSRVRAFTLAVWAAAFLLAVARAAPPMFEDVSAQLGHRHRENEFDDFAPQLLLPRRLSQFGPGLAWCDLNADGRDDLFVGAGKGGHLSILLSHPQGGFKQVISEQFAAPADLTGIAAWRDHRGAMQIFAGIANVEDYETRREAVRWWTMTLAEGERKAAVPGALSSTGAIAIADIDADGDLDLFVAGRAVPGRYPEPATSRIFKAVEGRFVLDEVNAVALTQIGLVSGAVFSDMNGDGFPDLVLAIEWDSLRVLMNNGKGELIDRTAQLGLAPYRGWWNGVTTGDLNGDGRMDIVATNWGLNSRYRVIPGHPLLIYFGELETPGRLDVIEAHYDPDLRKIVPERGYVPSVASMPFIKQRITTFKQFAESSVEEIYGEKLKNTKQLSATTLEHALFLNRGDRFEVRPLPIEAQFAPGFGVSIADFDLDGADDIVMTQNFFASQIEMPRCDAGRSLLLKGDGQGGLRAIPGQESGILVYGDARGLAVGDFDGDRKPDLAIGQNGAETKLFRNLSAKPAMRILLKGPAGNPAGFGAQLWLQSGNRSGAVREVRCGSGFWSQDSATKLFAVPDETPTAISVRWPGGKMTRQSLNGIVESVTIENGR